MRTVMFKGLLAHKRRLVGTFLAVFLGVAFLAGTLVLGDTLRGNFDNLFTEANAGTDVVVRHESKLSTDPGEPDSQRGLIDASLVSACAASTASPPPSRRSKASASSSARTATSSAATARRRSRATGSTTAT